jgi:hypothetical protein
MLRHKQSLNAPPKEIDAGGLRRVPNRAERNPLKEDEHKGKRSTSVTMTLHNVITSEALKHRVGRDLAVDLHQRRQQGHGPIFALN